MKLDTLPMRTWTENEPVTVVATIGQVTVSIVSEAEFCANDAQAPTVFARTARVLLSGSGSFEPEMAGLLASTISTASAIAKSRTFRKDVP